MYYCYSLFDSDDLWTRYIFIRLLYQPPTAQLLYKLRNGRSLSNAVTSEMVQDRELVTTGH